MSRTLAGLLLFNGLVNSQTPARLRLIRSLETLAFEEVRSSQDVPYNFTAFILHGLLGSGRNWRSFARSLSASLSPDWRFVLVDIRNHGRSADIKLLPPHDMQNAARDLANLVKIHGWDWPDVVMGHSMGGKVTLQFGESCASGSYGGSVKLPKQLMILDSVAERVNPENVNGEVEKVLRTLQDLPSPIPSRKWLVDHLMELGFSKILSEWLGSNLRKSGEKEAWSFNLEGAIEMFNSYRDMDYWPFLEDIPKDMEVTMVRAEKSDRWSPQTIKRLEELAGRKADEGRGNLSYYVLPNSGHWVHVENPKGLLEIVSTKLSAIV